MVVVTRLLRIVLPRLALACVSKTRRLRTYVYNIMGLFFDKESHWRASARIYSHPVSTCLRFVVLSLTCLSSTYEWYHEMATLDCVVESAVHCSSQTKYFPYVTTPKSKLLLYELEYKRHCAVIYSLRSYFNNSPL